MLGPSPDWIVGVSGLELCLTNCSWLDTKVLWACLDTKVLYCGRVWAGTVYHIKGAVVYCTCIVGTKQDLYCTYTCTFMTWAVPVQGLTGALPTDYRLAVLYINIAVPVLIPGDIPVLIAWSALVLIPGFACTAPKKSCTRIHYKSCTCTNYRSCTCAYYRSCTCTRYRI
jgi:hypothetical protein